VACVARGTRGRGDLAGRRSGSCRCRSTVAATARPSSSSSGSPWTLSSSVPQPGRPSSGSCSGSVRATRAPGSTRPTTRKPGPTPIEVARADRVRRRRPRIVAERHIARRELERSEGPHRTFQNARWQRARALRVEWLDPVASSALDQGVVEDRLVVVLAGDHDELVPGSRVDDPLVVDLSAETFGLDRGQGVAGPVRTGTLLRVLEPIRGLDRCPPPPSTRSGRRVGPCRQAP
jgi:hypothetical protein